MFKRKTQEEEEEEEEAVAANFKTSPQSQTLMFLNPFGVPR